MAKIVGIIGLGGMGLPIAEKLMEAGFEVIGRGRRGAARLSELGGYHADSVGEVSKRADIVITCLPSAQAVSEVVSGLAQYARPELTVIETSTIAPEVKQLQREILFKDGAELLDCPISGTPVQVRDGSLTIFMSGDKGRAAAVESVLGSFCSYTPYVGKFGTGTRMKAIAQMLGAIHNLAAAEALVMAERLGLDPVQVVEVVGRSAGSSYFFKFRGPKMARRDWSPSGGTLDAFLSSLKLIQDIFQSADVSAVLFQKALDAHQRAVDLGHGGDDPAAVLDILTAATGVKEGSTK